MRSLLLKRVLPASLLLFIAVPAFVSPQALGAILWFLFVVFLVGLLLIGGVLAFILWLVFRRRSAGRR